MQGSSKGAAASSSPENLVKMQILKTHSRPPETETLGWGPIIHISFFKKLKTFFKVLDFEIVLDLHLPPQIAKEYKRLSYTLHPASPNVAILHNHSAVITTRSDTDTTLLPNLQTLSKLYQLSFSSWDPIQDYTLHLAAIPDSLSSSASLCLSWSASFEESSLVICRPSYSLGLPGVFSQLNARCAFLVRAPQK